MKKLLLTFALALGLVGAAHSAGGGIAWDKAPNKINDLTSLQNGAKVFVNYCLNCHSAAFMRYNRLQDIGLTDQQIKDNLLFTTEKVGETMKAAIDPRQAKEWFGANPPDLTVIARSRAGPGGTGADYLYTYLRTYYADDTKATGWNNLAFPNVGMPHVLWELQGKRVPVYETVQNHGFYFMDTCEKYPWNNYYNHYDQDIYKDDIVLKCDDDIVFIDLQKLPKIIDYKIFYYLLNKNEGWGYVFLYYFFDLINFINFKNLI
jgi:ubiquinol-cytochrome c reductase cytochrome c1 subunit